MKRIVTGDIHLTSYKDDPIDEEFNLPKRLSFIIKSLKFICDYAIENKIEEIIYAGDTYNDKDIISTNAQNAFIQNIILMYPTLKFIIIDGNHDLSAVGENSTSCIGALAQFDNVTCIQGKNQIFGNINFVPFTKNGLKENIVERENSKILISHFGLNEAVLQSGISVKSELSCKNLQDCGYKLVILGHYHKPQILKNDNIKIIYVGNIIHANWNDRNENKRFIIFDDETFETQSIPLKNIFQEYKEFVISKNSTKDEIKNILENENKEKEKGNIVRIRNKSDEEFEINDNISVIIDKEVEIKERGVNISMSEDERLKAYLKYKNIPENMWEEYLKTAKRIISS